MSYSLYAQGTRTYVRDTLKRQQEAVMDMAQRRAARCALDAVDEVLVFHPAQSLGRTPDQIKVIVSGHSRTPGTASGFMRIEITDVTDAATPPPAPVLRAEETTPVSEAVPTLAGATA